ncbi:hypothetical protein K7X08_003620 [Anisodus acutangulus]|uniref:Uncharacterized protein n=1 Tax=Anisodus acutangulus TaxID=402998 RepID=A0A9Q1MKZ8_9SOLA|nr:hypothetical protein K7X08_003620 [Anisodus acutangulus]
MFPTSSKSTIPRASHLKHQVTESGISIQKNLGLRSSSRKVRNSQEKAKADAEPLKDKSSSCILRGNGEKSTSKLQASTESSPVNKASNTGVEMNPDATLPSSRAHSSECHDVCTPYALRLPHNTPTAVSSMQYLPAQAMKPSGLRMPSPSLGYFRQTKASNTRRLLKEESSMCLLQRSGDLRPPEALARQEGRVNLANQNCRILGMESESSTASCKVIKTVLEGNNVEKMKIPSVIKKLDPVSEKVRDPAGNFDEKALDHIKHEEKKLQDAELLMSGEQHPAQTAKHEHINKDGNLMNSIPGFIENKGSAGSDFRDAQFPQARYNTQSLALQELEGAIGNPKEAEESGISSVIDGLICNSHYRNMINLGEEVMEEGYVGGCNNLPGREFETVKFFAVEDGRIFDNDKYIMRIKSNLSKARKELRNNGGGNCESLNLTGSDFREEMMEKSEVASQHEDSQNLNEAFTSKQITDRVQTGGLLADVSSETLFDENCETNPGGPSIYSELKSQGGRLLHSSDQSLSKYVCIDQSQDEQIAETSLSALSYRPEESGFDSFDVTSEQTELESNRITVVGEDPADIICSSPVKITLAENCNHSTDEKILANSTSSLEFGSSSSGTRDKMVSDVPGSVGECRKPITESVLDVPSSIGNLSNCQNEGNNLTSSMEFCSSSRGTEKVIGSGILGPMGAGDRDQLIKDMFLFKGMDKFEIRDSSNNPSDGKQIIKVKLGMSSPESLQFEESHMCCHADLIPSSSPELEYHKVVLDILHTPPQLGDTRQGNEVGKTTDALTNILQMESHDNDAQLLPGKDPSTVVEECERSNAFENFRDALLARKSVDEGGLESQSFLITESTLIHGSGNAADELDVIHCNEDRLSYPAAIESLSLELDSSQGTSKNHKASVTTDCIELVEGDQTSSRIKRKVIDILNQDIEVKESETGKPSGSESSHNELCHGLEDTQQCTNDNTISPVKNTDSCMKKGNLLILPPRDAVPFSDEWLAAMEAAGEDILTMKGGAVQNSPQEKSLPEPNPWSPVKKKNNQLGPFDCTKFHHNGPPES